MLKILNKLFVSTAILFFLGATTLLSAAEQKAGPIKTAYTATKISDSTYVIHGPLESPTPENQGFMNNPAFIIGDAGIIVIDAGSTVQVGEMVLDIIKEVSDLPVVATLSTHIHGDHWLANQAISTAYPDVVHYAHPKLIEQANNGEGAAWVSLMNNSTNGASAGTVFLSPDTETNDGDVLTIEGRRFSIYHDEIAHTNTDIAIRLDKEGVLFMGDTVINGQLRRMDDGNFKGLIAFLDRMLKVDANIYVPGHGKTGSIQLVQDYKQVMETIFYTVQKEYENGLSDFEIKPIIVENMKNKSQWGDIDTALGKIVSLAYLEAEDDAF